MEHEHEMHFLFHPMLVHFPIAFYFLELVLLVLWTSKRDDSYLRFALLSFKFGYFFMIVAMAAGLKDVGGISNITGAVRTHVYGALSVFAFYTVRAFLWRSTRGAIPAYRFTHLFGAVIGNVLVLVTGYFGGRLVFS